MLVPSSDASLFEQVCRDNVALYRRVIELEAQDRSRLSRIAQLKLDVQRLSVDQQVASNDRLY